MPKKRKTEDEVRSEEVAVVLAALAEYGVPLDAQEKIVLGSWRFVRQSAGYTEIHRAIYGTAPAP